MMASPGRAAQGGRCRGDHCAARNASGRRRASCRWRVRRLEREHPPVV